MFEDNIAEQHYLSLGGIEQWIWLYGKNIKNPILIFLHGGPGISLHGAFRYFHNELENHFVVIGWDQRGTGKSRSNLIPPSSMTINSFVSDLHELIGYLKKKFNQDKVYILGESWGSLLGITYAHQYPDNVAAFIGTGQISNSRESERLGYEFILAEAKKRNNQEALAQLRNVKQPPFSYFDDINILRNWLMKFGGCLYNQTSYEPLLKVLAADQNAMPDFSGVAISLRALHKELFHTNLFTQIPELKVPVYFLEGKHDYQVSSKLASQYFQYLKAPKKELVWFEYSGHNPMFEEPDNFRNVLLSIVYNISFKALEEKDLPLFFSWVKKPHISIWWESGTYEDFVEKYNPGKAAENYVFPFIIYINKKPIGYIQYYDYGWWVKQQDQPAETVGIDIIIGETEYIGKGFGTIIINKFVEKISKETNPTKIIVDPDLKNIAAIRCYEKVGFKKVREIDSQSFFDAPPGKLLLMELKR